MTTTYGADPSGSTLDRLRLLIGDTGPTGWLLSDEEILAISGMSSGVYSAAASLCRALAARFAQDAPMAVPGLSVGSGQARYYLDLAKEYAARAILDGEGTSDTPPGGDTAGLGAPVATGISVSDIIANDRDCDRVPSRFSTAREGYGGRGPYGWRGW